VNAIEAGVVEVAAIHDIASAGLRQDLIEDIDLHTLLPYSIALSLWPDAVMRWNPS